MEINELSAAMAGAIGNRHAEAMLLPALARLMPGKRAGNKGPALHRMMAMVQFGSTDCWHFCGHNDSLGYGRFPAVGENKAHRVSWRIFRGGIPARLRVLHKCDVRNCVNPDHLFLGTQADNVRDMCEKGRNKSVPLHGERNPMARLTTEQVADIRAMASAGLPQINAARKYGVSPMTVSRIVRGESWNA